jgi:hypothetical protein
LRENDERLLKMASTTNMILSEKTRQKFRKLFALCKWLFTPIALTFLLAAVYHSRVFIRNTLAHSLPGYFILAVLAWMAAQLLSPWFVNTVLTGCGEKVEYRKILDLHLRYLPARYIPGGIWHTVARIGGLHRLGVHSTHLGSFVFLENLVALGVTLTVGGTLVGLHSVDRLWQPIAFVSALTSLTVLLVCPILMNRLILKTFGRIWYQNYIVAVIISILFWSFATTSFLLFISAFPTSIVTSGWLEIAGAYLFSWGMGFIAIFAPQGVGVFEVVAANLISANLPFSALVALLLGFRLVIILSDVCMWAGWISYIHLKNQFSV